jgi:protein-L-isoaspartate(D-aspartate) O-methyltransferase
MAPDTATTTATPSGPHTTVSDRFEAARANMVNSQIRPNRVNDPRVLRALRHLPRERFLPEALSHLAYVDEDIPLGNGRSMLEPMVLARMLEAAQPRESERVLVVAAGAGYGAAVLDACGCKVIALEEDAALLALARRILPLVAPEVSLVSGPIGAGWPSEAPYDLILIEGAVPAIPAALADQLAPHTGRLIGAMRAEGRMAQTVIGERTKAGLRTTKLFDCATPMLPALQAAAVFEF